MPVHELRARLDATTEEITHFLRGIRGEFVPQGPSGSPMRGSAHILPTGRNFYMIDPTAIPGRAAWATGKRLADQMLEKHRAENGMLPESITMVVYAGETITTGGDDIAEIMYLYGIQPVWFGGTDRVIGLEVIPIETLGRPRIDVTLRISGLFRDTFPNLIERIEDAVNLVASLDEPFEKNYVRKHIDEDIQQFITDGMSREQAFDMACLRIFGCPPGTYGAGVDIMVNSKKWETQADLGRAYVNWSSHAYSRIFLDDVAQMLGTRAVIPKHYDVANALGAISSNIYAVSTVEIKPNSDAGGINGYTVFGNTETKIFEALETAESFALREAEEGARAEAIKRGARGEIAVTSRIITNEAVARNSVIYLGTRAVAQAVGTIGF